MTRQNITEPHIREEPTSHRGPCPTITANATSHPETVVHKDVSEQWIKDLEAFYPNTGDQVIEWRRDGARKLFNKIYSAGVADGELFANAKRNI